MATLRMILIIVFLIAALTITVVVLLQEGKSAGLGAMGGTTNNDSYWDKNKKHSLEGKFERWTKMMAGIFVLTAFIIMLIPNQSSSKAEVVQPSPTATVEATDNANAEASASPEASVAPEESAAPSESPAQ